MVDGFVAASLPSPLPSLLLSNSTLTRLSFSPLSTHRKLTLVTSQLHAPGETGSSKGTVSKVTHLDVAKDEFTGYMAPRKVKFEWAGPVEGVSGVAFILASEFRGGQEEDET